MTTNERRPGEEAAHEAGGPESSLRSTSDTVREAAPGRICWPEILTVGNRLAHEHADLYGAPTLRRVHYLVRALFADLSSTLAGESL